MDLERKDGDGNKGDRVGQNQRLMQRRVEKIQDGQVHPHRAVYVSAVNDIMNITGAVSAAFSD